MGEAKRKRSLMEREWLPLFSADVPVRAAISRPSARPETTRRYEQQIGVDIAAAVAAGQPMLCLNPACSNELHTVPDVRAFVQIAANHNGIVLGACVQCATGSDDVLREFIRELLGKQYGLDGVRRGPAVQADIPSVVFTAAGVQIAFECQPKDDSICPAATEFAALLEQGKLERFIAMRHGVSNCHAMVDLIRSELERSGDAHRFAFKRGCSELLQHETDPRGQHSWIEFDGWAIDVSNGAVRAISVMRTETLYATLQLTNIHDL